MRFGCCAGLESTALIQEAGYDYIELPVKTVVAESPDAEFAPVRQQILSHRILPEAWNCFLPGSLKIVGTEVDSYRIERFIETALHRISSVGGEVVVFGSGGARRIPEGFPVDTARAQIAEFLARCNDAASRHDIVIAIEPLNRKECNVINSVAEAVEFVEAIGSPAIKALADSYHMFMDDEPLSNIHDAGWNIAHTHTSEGDRKAPCLGKYDYAGFFRALREVGYDLRVSIECAWQDFGREIGPSLEVVREAWGK